MSLGGKLPVNKRSDALVPDLVIDAAACQNILASTEQFSSRHAFHKLVLALAVSRRNTLTLRFHTFITRVLGVSKPAYFHGETRSGVRFLGDYFDLDCAFWESRKNHSQSVIDLLANSVIEYSKTCQSAAGYTFIDVGCNGGVLSASVMRQLAHREAESGPVELVAVEANPETALRAAGTFALNELSRVHLARFAAGDAYGAVDFLSADGLSGQASIHSIDAKLVRSVDKYPIRKISVPQRPLDSLIQGGFIKKPVACIKIDVEGHELAVIRGAWKLLSAHRPFVLCEYNPRTAMAAGWNALDLHTEIESAMGPCQFTVMHYDAPPTEFPPNPDSGDIVDILVRPLSRDA
jgi:FkbM family methyltransferase